MNFLSAVWTALATLNADWLATTKVPWDNPSRSLHVAYKLLEFPDAIGVVALPWARSAPILGLVLLAVLTLAVLQVIAAELRTPTDAQLILLILVCMVAVASLSHPPRYETRYVFFLYPAAVAVAVAAVARFLDARFSDLRISPLATLAVVAAGFAVTGDLQPHRMLNIDSEAANFGLGLRPGEKSNLLNRSDPRGAANWLTTNVRSEPVNFSIARRGSRASASCVTMRR